ncbi:SRPBCC family protein [Roseixanthobacter glucoisosaccharinicivorans]|uniref:SRPBCC family protein n=1 Tax=Roseixanthobacter glucoisosaccharinicivorans TaxID=3119923 RepID=UPI003726C754
MDMSGSQRIEASPAAVWAALNDPEVLKQCIPGCESIAKTSDTQMEAVVVLRVGPVKASFKGAVTLSDIVPEQGYTITGEGSGGLAGYAKGSAKVRLEPQDDATLLHYEVKADVGGKLAQLGARLIDATAKKLAGEFFTNFGAVVAPPPAAAEAPAESGEEAEAAPATGTEKAGKGWLGGLFGKATAGALVAGFLLVPPCCLNGTHAHAAGEFAFPICHGKG